MNDEASKLLSKMKKVQRLKRMNISQNFDGAVLDNEKSADWEKYQ